MSVSKSKRISNRVRKEQDSCWASALAQDNKSRVTEKKLNIQNVRQYFTGTDIHIEFESAFTYKVFHAFCKQLIDQKAIDLLLDLNYAVPFLTKIAKQNPVFIRPIETWKRNSRSPREQFRSFLKHLIEKYPVPPFIWDCIEAGRIDVAGKYIRLGRGDAIRTVFDAARLTRKGYHYLSKIEGCNNVDDAVLKAELTTYGFTSNETETVLDQVKRVRGHICNNLRNNLNGMFLFIAEHKSEVDFDTIGEVAQYLEEEQLSSFNWKGRSWNNLLYKAREKASLKKKVEETPTKTWKNKMGSIHKIVKILYYGQSLHFEFVELVSDKALFSEASYMRNCVYSDYYRNKCARGSVVIFSLRNQEEILNRKILAHIELNPETLEITQVRARHNKRVDQSISDIIDKWAEENQFSKTIYCY